MTHINISVPGKLFLIGEYAVTHTGYPAIITSVPKYLTISIEEHQKNMIYSTQKPNIVLEWTKKNGQVITKQKNIYPLVTKSIEVVEQFLQDEGIITTKQYQLHISSELNNQNGQKYGLGSSGAVTVATIKAILTLYDYPTNPLVLYKLSAIAHLLLTSNGSFGDLAASAFDTTIAYTLFDKEWLIKQLKIHSLSSIIHSNWQQLSIQQLFLPQSLKLLVGWTQSPASTARLVNDIAQQKSTKHYNNFLIHSKTCVLTMIDAIQSEDIPTIHKCMNDYRQLLQQLSPLIETPSLNTLCNIANKYGASAKTSGAGGGDCGICLVDTIEKANQIQSEWLANGIKPLFT